MFKKYLIILILFLASFQAFAQADLIIIGSVTVTAPNPVHVGITINVKFSVQNIGSASAGLSRTGIYLQGPPPLAEILLTDISLESLAAGATSNNIECNIPIPYTVTNSGNYSLIVKLNRNNAIAESNYSNNLASTNINIDKDAWAAQNLPYPIIFIHGLIGDNTTWKEMVDSLQNFYGWSYGGNMNFCLNADANVSTSNKNVDYRDFTNVSLLRPNDFFTVNFDVNFDGTPYVNSIINESNQSSIVKQGLAISDAIKHVLNVTGKEKVILIGHSMGGLAAREYLQNPSIWQVPSTNHKVAQLLTVGTPHGGSNATDLGLSLSLKLDLRSEAIRDLRTSYYYSYYWPLAAPNPNTDAPGAYLFGGVEDLDYLRDQFLFTFYNADINSDGVVSGQVVAGLNFRNIPLDLAYSCIIGTGALPVNGDGVVTEYSANLNNFRPVNAKTFFLPRRPGSEFPWHNALSEQFDAIIQGADEPNNVANSFKISTDKLYYGNITYQNVDGTVRDFDAYRINISSLSKVSLQFSNLTTPLVSINVRNGANTSVFNFASNGKSYIDTSINLAAGTYYIVFSGVPTIDSYKYPYAFKYSLNPVASSCSGTTTLQTTSGSFSDGSGSSNYLNNLDCRWKIQPSGASSITLNFANFDVNNLGDTLFIYDGVTTASPLLGKFTGNTLPASLTSTGGKMLVQFLTDGSVTAPGWAANYSSVSVPTFCSGGNVLTSESGAFSDGSGTSNYSNNSNCSWLLSPPGAYSITLNFNIFNTEAGNDFVNVYDGSDNNAPLLGSFSGNSIPASLTSSGGIMFIEFVSNNTITSTGWNASYTSFVPYSSDGIIEWEYWFDANYNTKISEPISPQANFGLNSSIPTNNLNSGLHVFSMRFKTNEGIWSSVLSSFIYKIHNNFPSGVSAYEYWIDNNYNTKTVVTLQNSNDVILLSDLQTNNIAQGLHAIHFRFKPDGKHWSSTLTSFFYKPLQTVGKIRKYQYWIDDKATQLTTISVSETDNLDLISGINFSGISSGLHTFHIRFENTAAIWSSVSSSFFYKPNTPVVNILKLSGYRYWFNNNLNAITDVALQAFVNPLELWRDVCIPDLVNGKHSIHIQFKDSLNIWSSIVTDTFYKVSPPQPLASASGPLSFCNGGNVTLTALSCTGCNYEWNTGAITQAITATQAGNYFVRIKYPNDCSLVSDTFKVLVNTIASQPGLINGNISVVSGQTNNYSISVVTGAVSYLWNLSGGGNITSGQGSTSININWTLVGTYLLTVKAVNACGESVTREISINVSTATGITNLDDRYLIRIVPNPSDGAFFVKANGAVNKNISIVVFNNLGQVVYTENKVIRLNDYISMINLKGIANGVYFVKIIIDNGLYMRKLIKQD